MFDRWARRFLSGFVRLYQKLAAPIMPPVCRFVPSCSNYALEVLQRKPLISGLWLIFKRILRCNPFHPGGYDPVP
ncbi:MAG TPA: membrane protein insertion efficiency factor YidD [Candidatus Sumerlaeia bacterium]|nr:membrane protein insertion efficiency factor YidD [Candidatus Sumerlaeia bacterium]